MKGREDAAAQFASERFAGDRLDDESGDHVVRVRVGVPGARREERLVGEGELDQRARWPVVGEVAAQVGLEYALVTLVVEEAAGVVEQFADRDPAAVGDESGEEALDGIVQRQLPLA